MIGPRVETPRDGSLPALSSSSVGSGKTTAEAKKKIMMVLELKFDGHAT